MKELFFLLTLLFHHSGGEKKINLNDLNGCWYSQNGKNKMYACWKKESSGSMQYFYELNSRGDTVKRQSIRLELSAAAHAIAPVSVNKNKKQPVKFHCTKSVKNRLQFENLLNDYPQKVSIQLISGNKLQYSEQGNINGIHREESFLFEKQ